MFFRVVIATFLLGIATFIRIKVTGPSSQTALAPTYLIIALTYLLSFTGLFIPKIIKNIRANIYIQSILDLSLITGLVYVTGGVESIYSVLYPLVIIYSALFLAGRGGLISASASSIFYGLLLDLEYYGIIRPIYQWGYDYDCDAGYVFSRIFVHIISFYIIALLTSYAVKQEKKTRELLAEKESAFDQLDLLHRSIIESVDTGILTIDLNGNIKSFNTGAEKITGFLRFKIINKKVDDVFPFFSDMLNKEGPWKPGGRFEITDSEKILGCSVSPLVDGNREKIGNILIFQDLTIVKEMEYQIEKNKQLAFVGEMAAGLAHEIRNPLASISGPIQMLREDLKLDETDKRLMQIILRGKDRLEGFVKDFLLLARPKQSERKDIDVKVIIDDVLESFRFSSEWSEDIEVIMNLCDQAGIYGNKAEIRQVIWNLILNAVQAMPEGGRLKIEIRHVFNDKKKYLEIQISDTGCGIEEKNQDRVFEPFYTTKESGTGLGMAIVNRIVESHMGKIRIKSKPGKGTDCIVLLPVKELRVPKVS
ncbi:MAG: two-component system, NtrC family, sensor histidine kinase PilS [Desulfobacteraceae bacterium Eth-SRB1]|nr:MAG: two-component system, NtrC family, sensor histidine kinase PilS [Desulfobacteraceae bacterium Eth-SRB1]